MDCSDLKSPICKTGIYQLNMNGTINVLCEINDNGGGWTVSITRYVSDVLKCHCLFNDFASLQWKKSLRLDKLYHCIKTGSEVIIV